jgi:hypothetical protein
MNRGSHGSKPQRLIIALLPSGASRCFAARHYVTSMLRSTSETQQPGELANTAAQEQVVRAEGVEPSRAVKLNGFSCHLRLSPPPSGVCGLDYPFTLPRRFRGLGAARLVSTPSQTERSVRAWLGIAISGFPEFGQFCIAVSLRALKFASSPLRLPFRHARVAGHLQVHIIEQTG